MEPTTPTAPGLGFSDRYLTPAELEETVRAGLASLDLAGKRVLVIVPDGTRTMPLAQMHRLLDRYLRPQATALDYLIALGTHMPMDDAALSRHFGAPVVGGQLGASHVHNHRWMDPGVFVQLGVIPAAEIEQLSGGLFAQDVPVRINRLALAYDRLLVVGPVFPHEVMGFSGGNKYFFPGIAGPEVIDFTHWLGAVMTNLRIIGAGYTPVRAVIDRAAAFIPTPAACFALVVDHGGVAGIYYGTLRQAWQPAAALSARKHITYVDRPYQRVISVMPTLYDDLWTGGKGMYKMEPVVADGGEVIIYAPHINEVSYTHGRVLDEIGYHTRDYFLKQWPRFEGYPWGVLAHSTHVKGAGAYDPASGLEAARIRVTLATGIPAERCARINLGYRDPASIHLEEWQGREDEGILVVPRAGEMLYRLKETV
jgi:nickel-dependent lactate racemase